MADVVPTSLIGIGARRAAAVLIGLGPDVAAEVFKSLGENEVRRIAIGARDLRHSGQDDVRNALGQFVESLEAVGGDTASGENVLREVAEKSLGPDLAKRAFEAALPRPPPDEILGPLTQADAESLAMVLSREAPQTVALVLSAIDRSVATAAVMDWLPADQRPQILRRMATIEGVAPEVLREVGEALSSEIRSAVSGGLRKIDGRATTIEILRRSTPDEQTTVLAEIERVDADLAAALRAKLFTFDDIGMLSDRDIQTLIKEIDTKRLSQALKGSTPEIKQKFLKNMATRAAAAFEDDLAMMGAVKLSAVEEAQAEISKIALGLAEQGRITLVNPSDRLL